MLFFRLEKNLSTIRARRGFTLIELLVVIAIIAILAAILFPVFSSARVSARKAQCGSNMRQLGMGIQMYVDDYDGVMPVSSHTEFVQEHCWVYTLTPYLGKVDQIRICPSDPFAQQRLAEKGTSYVLNEYLVVEGAGAQLNLYNLPRPADTITAFIISDASGPSWTQDHTHSRNWFRRNDGRAWRRILADIQPDRHRLGAGRGFGRDREEGGANYLYGDGHVKLIPAARIKGWADANFDFARPLEQ